VISTFVENKGDADKEKKQDGPGKALSIAAYPIAAVSGGWVFRDQIYEESYASHDRKGGFEDIKQKGLTRYLEIQNDPTLATDKKWEAIKANNIEFNSKRTAKLESMGYTNVFKHAGTISPLARNNAIIAGFTVAGITLGSLLLIANGPNIWKELFGDNNKDKGAER
jgi:hypothetical protein